MPNNPIYGPNMVFSHRTKKKNRMLCAAAGLLLPGPKSAGEGVGFLSGTRTKKGGEGGKKGSPQPGGKVGYDF